MGLIAPPTSTESGVTPGFVGRIPVRNLWLLMLYASDLFRTGGTAHVAVEESPDELPDLVAEILAHAVETRLHRQLSLGYRSREEWLTRVRGRIDVLTTARHQLLDRGLVACRFAELTIDTPRNRFVRCIGVRRPPGHEASCRPSVPISCCCDVVPRRRRPAADPRPDER